MFYALTVVSDCRSLLLSVVYFGSAIVRLDRKRMNISERKEYRTILGPVYENGKEYWRILTLWHTNFLAN
jgi:hypothetical protein